MLTPLSYAFTSTCALILLDSKSALQKPLFGISPNPTTDTAWLCYPAEMDGAGSVSIFDMQGKLIDQFQMNHKGLAPIDMGDYPAGVYLIKMYTSGVMFDNIKLTVVR